MTTTESQPNAALRFEAATKEQQPAIVALVERAYRGEPSRKGWTTEADLLDGQRTDLEAVAELASRPGSYFLLGVEGDQLIASLHLEVAEQTAEIGMFAVEPTAQGSGIGSRLLKEAERRARSAGATRLVMAVIAQRTDILSWYGRRGYYQTGATAAFPYGQPRYGLPRRADLHFLILEKALQP